MLSSREPGCSHICKDAYFKYGPILQLRVDYLMGAPLNPLQVYSSTGAPLRGGDSLARTKRIRGSRAEDQHTQMSLPCLTRLLDKQPRCLGRRLTALTVSLKPCPQLTAGRAAQPGGPRVSSTWASGDAWDKERTSGRAPKE